MSAQPDIEWPIWATSPPGRTVLSWEQEQLDTLVSDIFGYHAVQLGLPQLNTLRENRMPCRTLALDTAPGTEPNAFLQTPGASFASITRCAFPALPFAAQSVDLLVLPHTLELTREPHQLLHEAVRALLPEGQIVITGFNSLSLWGLRHGIGRITHHPFIPAPFPLITLSRLKDWLKLLGFELNQGHFGLYTPPCSTERWLNRYRFLEAAGSRWWPIFGAVYIITAVKRMRGIQLIGPAQLNKPSLLSAPSPVSTSQTVNK